EPSYSFFAGVSPLVIPFNIGSIEAEAAVAQGTSLGASASYTELNDTRYSTAEAKLRFYPSDNAFQGIALGIGAGLTRFSKLVTSCCGPGALMTRESLDAPTIGMLIDYDWTPDAHNRRFVIGVGGEAKRIIATDDDRNRLGLQNAYLSGRLIVGLAF
ncbi:MAG TPA: hypothetical protein VMH39_02095, partial [Gemmatimonadaceae bacterium]|nr:hypothetical protein [Gemmatimonadaceae bacterium]